VVLPLHDDNPVRRTPVITYLLILINVVVFLGEPAARDPLQRQQSVAAVCAQSAYFDRYAAIPKELLTNRQLPAHRTGVQTDQGVVVCPVERYDKIPVLSVLYAMFLHGGWLHLAGNMLFLFIFGNNVEDRLGRLRYLGFYVLCGYAAAYGFALSDPSSTTTLVGASGAVAGVLGAYLLLFPNARVTSVVPPLFFLPFRLPAWVVLGFWFLLQYWYSAGAAVGSGAGVAYLAHVVGFLVGAVLVVPFRRRRPPPPAYPQVWRAGY
jgi:membrane associated rhomboid family serine protease